jgi:eukaryotic-like serine/threonine-protein kinase
VSAFSLIGQVYDGRYLIERQIGSGGMADVYLATDQSLGRKVAIKVLSDRYARDAAFVERFRREAAAAAGLRHPNIVTVYDRGEAMGTYYIAMEYLDGPTLKEEITRRAPLPEPEAINYATQALAALDAAHRQGVIHRDIKPHNMVLTEDGRLKVTDFGIARAANTQQMTEVGSIVGTAQYLSPEQARGQAVGPQSDIYSMGVVLYEMLCGELPFTGESAVDIAMKQVSDMPPPLHGRNRLVSPAMEQVVMRALAKDPALRFASARQMADELARVARGQAASSDTQQATRVIAAADATRVIGQPPEGATRVLQPPPPPPERPAPRRSALPWLLVLLLLVLAAVAGFVVYHMLSGNDQSVPQGLVGQTCKQAMATLETDGLKGTCVKVKSTVAQKGKIIRTDPSSGSSVSKGDTVKLFQGAGPNALKMPVLRGLSVFAAETKLQAIGFTATPTTVTVNSVKPFNTVVASVPRAGNTVAPNVPIVLHISNGQIAVPDVTGQTCAKATKTLAAKHLKATCQPQASTTVPSGRAISTTPAAGQPATANASVTVFISSGPGQLNVPSVLGDTKQQAIQTLTSQGFKVNAEQTVVCDQNQNNIVQTQSPDGGQPAQQGSTVTIKIGKYSPFDPSCTGPPGST